MTEPTPTPTPTPAPAPWHQGVEAETIGFWQNKGYDLADPKAFATKITEHYRNAEKALGIPADRVLQVPSKKADGNYDEAEWKTLYQKLGVPKDVKEYDFSGIKFTDGTELDEGFTTAMRSELYNSNVSKDKAPNIVKAVIKYLDDADKSEAAIRDSKLAEQKANLVRSWGKRLDENLLAAKQAARRLGIDDTAVNALESVIGYDKVMEMFRRIGAGTNEDTFVEGRNPAPATVETAKARLQELKNDRAWAERFDKGDAQATREYRALAEQITGVSYGSL